jgi:hypothetical protein
MIGAATASEKRMTATCNTGACRRRSGRLSAGMVEVAGTVKLAFSGQVSTGFYA